jgi:hypothetical protein
MFERQRGEWRCNGRAGAQQEYKTLERQSGLTAGKMHVANGVKEKRSLFRGMSRFYE